MSTTSVESSRSAAPGSFGPGYPDGLCGDAIPRIARVFAVVDVFDDAGANRNRKQQACPNVHGYPLIVARVHVTQREEQIDSV